MTERTVELDLDIVRESKLSLLVSDGTTEAWIPKKYIDENADGTFTVAEWIARDRGLV